MADDLLKALVQREAAVPDMDLARAHMESQMPEAMKHVKSIQPLKGWFGYPPVDDGNVATTSPFSNTIRYNEKRLQEYANGDQSKVDDVLAHELTHVQQNADHWMPMNVLRRILQTNKFGYRDQPDEKEAFATNNRRAAYRKDIELPAEKP